MSIILRVDDFPGTKPEEFSKHNLENFKMFDEVLAKNKINQYVLGVIPAYTSDESLKWIFENPRIQVALHGITHDERFLNEFRDHETQDEITSRLLKAKESLERFGSGKKVVHYIPPHNCVDLRTARALSRAGFTDLMCGPGTDLNQYSMITNSRIFGKDNLTYSQKPFMYGRTDEMMSRDNALPEIEKIFQSGKFSVLTLHWTWEWNIGLDSLDRFMSHVSKFIGSRRD